MPIPISQMFLGPVECLVQMAQVARIGDSKLDAARKVGGGNLVTADSVEQGICGTWHMAIQAVASG